VDDTSGLGERSPTIGPIGEVVQRAKQQDDVERPVALFQVSGVTEIRGERMG